MRLLAKARDKRQCEPLARKRVLCAHARSRFFISCSAPRMAAQALTRPLTILIPHARLPLSPIPSPHAPPRVIKCCVGVLLFLRGGVEGGGAGKVGVGRRYLDTGPHTSLNVGCAPLPAWGTILPLETNPGEILRAIPDQSRKSCSLAPEHGSLVLDPSIVTRRGLHICSFFGHSFHMQRRLLSMITPRSRK